MANRSIGLFNHSLKINQAVRIQRGKSKVDLLDPVSSLPMVDAQPPD
jgi:hypothetical protein